MDCKRCGNTRIVLVRTPDRRSLAGYQQVAKSCPECRPMAYPLVEPDRKMASANDSMDLATGDWKRSA